MKTFEVTLYFTNLDNFMGTDQKATMAISIKSDDFTHAHLLAQRLQKVMDADHFDVDEA